jgi:hypothetical protein
MQQVDQSSNDQMARWCLLPVDEGGIGRWLQTLSSATHKNRFKILPSVEDPQSLWAVHGAGCWKISFPWFTTLSKAVSSASRDCASSSLLTKRVLADQELEMLSPPSITELHLAKHALGATENHAVQAACVMSDIFLGDGLLIASQQSVVGLSVGSQGLPAAMGQAGPSLQFFRRKKAAAAAAAAAEPSSAESCGGGELELLLEASEGLILSDGSKAAGSPSSIASKRMSLLDSSLEAIYGGLTTCPRLKLKSPQQGEQSKTAVLKSLQMSLLVWKIVSENRWTYEDCV